MASTGTTVPFGETFHSSKVLKIEKMTTADTVCVWSKVYRTPAVSLLRFTLSALHAIVTAVRASRHLCTPWTDCPTSERAFCSCHNSFCHDDSATLSPRARLSPLLAPAEPSQDTLQFFPSALSSYVARTASFLKNQRKSASSCR